MDHFADKRVLHTTAGGRHVEIEVLGFELPNSFIGEDRIGRFETGQNIHWNISIDLN